MADYQGKKIYIVITDQRPDSNGTGGASTGSNADNDKSERNQLKKYAEHQFYNFIKSESQTAVNYTINNIGNFTGNYQTQREMQNVVGHSSRLVSLGESIIFGASIGGLAGAAIAGGVTLVSSLINFGLESYSIGIAEKKANYAIEQLRARSGLNTLNDGSRGTEN